MPRKTRYERGRHQSNHAQSHRVASQRCYVLEDKKRHSNELQQIPPAILPTPQQPPPGAPIVFRPQPTSSGAPTTLGVSLVLCALMAAVNGADYTPNEPCASEPEPPPLPPRSPPAQGSKAPVVRLPQQQQHEMDHPAVSAMPAKQASSTSPDAPIPDSRPLAVGEATPSEPAITFRRLSDSLHSLITQNEAEAAKALLESTQNTPPFRDLSKIRSAKGYSLFETVLRIEHPQAAAMSIMAFLLEKGVDVNEPLSDGFTPLGFAMGIKGHHGIALARFLLDKGANINVAGRGSVPIIRAFKALIDPRKMVDLLLSPTYHLEVDKTDNIGFTPLVYAMNFFLAGDYNYLEIIHKLVDRGANPLIYGFEQISLLESVQLKKMGADPKRLKMLQDLENRFYDAVAKKQEERKCAFAQKAAAGPIAPVDSKALPNPYGPGGKGAFAIATLWDGACDHVTKIPSQEDQPGEMKFSCLRVIGTPDDARLGEALNDAELYMAYTATIDMAAVIPSLWPLEKRHLFYDIFYKMNGVVIPRLPSRDQLLAESPDISARSMLDPFFITEIGPKQFFNLLMKKQKDVIFKLADAGAITREFLAFKTDDESLDLVFRKNGLKINMLWVLASKPEYDAIVDKLVDEEGLLTEDLLLSVPKDIPAGFMDGGVGSRISPEMVDQNVLGLLAKRGRWKNVEKLLRRKDVVTNRVLHAGGQSSAFQTINQTAPVELRKLLPEPSAAVSPAAEISSSPEFQQIICVFTVMAFLIAFNCTLPLGKSEGRRDKERAVKRKMLLPQKDLDASKPELPDAKTESADSPKLPPKKTEAEPVMLGLLDKEQLRIWKAQLTEANGRLLPIQEADQLRKDIKALQDEITALSNTSVFSITKEELEQQILQIGKNQADLLSRGRVQYAQKILPGIKKNIEALQTKLKRAEGNLGREITDIQLSGQQKNDVGNLRQAIAEENERMDEFLQKIALWQDNLSAGIDESTLKKIEPGRKRHESEVDKLSKEVEGMISQLREADLESPAEGKEDKKQSSSRQKSSSKPSAAGLYARRGAAAPLASAPPKQKRPRLDIKRALRCITHVGAAYENTLEYQSDSKLRDYIQRGCLFFSVEAMLENLSENLRGRGEDVNPGRDNLRKIRNRLVHKGAWINNRLRGENAISELMELVKGWPDKLKHGSLNDICAGTFSGEHFSKYKVMHDIASVHQYKMDQARSGWQVNEVYVNKQLADFIEAERLFNQGAEADKQVKQISQIAKAFFVAELSAEIEEHAPSPEKGSLRDLVDDWLQKDNTLGNATKDRHRGILVLEGIFPESQGPEKDVEAKSSGALSRVRGGH